MEHIMEHKCPSCGAPLRFDPEQGVLLCDSCGNRQAIPAELQIGDVQLDGFDFNVLTDHAADEHADALPVYHCVSCGAEVIVPEARITTTCPYCGNNIVLTDKVTGKLRPDGVIPFGIDQKHLPDAVNDFYRGKALLPRDFFTEHTLGKVTGVYVPFWMFDCDCDASILYNAQRVTAWSDSNYNYTKTDYYKLFRSGSVGFANIPVDGSKKADDAYMEAVEPFNYEDAALFSGAYLSGYLADKYDVSAEESIERANERVKNSTIEAFNDTTNRYTAVIPENSRVSFSNGKIRYSLLPVWMLNIKYMDKMYKFAINGQTGKVVGEYPVDNRKKWKYFWKIAGISYAVAIAIAYMLLH